MLIGLGSLFAQTGQEYWQELSPASAKSFNRLNPFPTSFKAYQLNFESLKAHLNQAPLEWNATNASLDFTLPGPEGEMMTFEIVETKVMPDPLAAKFPGIKTFLGKSKTKAGTFIRLDYTYLGFRAKIRAVDYTYWIEPVAVNVLDTYIGFYNKDAGNYERGICGTEEFVEPVESRPNQARNNSGNELLTYRCAFASDEFFTNIHGGKPQAQSAIVSTVNFLNDILEVEMAIRLELIPNNDILIFDSTDDPYTNNDGTLDPATYIGSMAQENQSLVPSIIGLGNFDLSQVFTRPVQFPGGSFIGGIAAIQGVCSSSSKARSVSATFNPVNVGFFQTMAHETGHQFGANHTFNSNTGICQGQRASSAAYEPGNGTTLLSYEGCEFVDNSDSYYHVHSYQEMFNFSRNGGGSNCPTIISTGNQPPVVTADSGGWVIPISTPFMLKASGFDPDGDPITYSWEQYDRQSNTTPLNNPSGNAPIFRSLPAVTDSFRIFPRIQSIISGNTTAGERLPTYSRGLTFRVSVRDNRNGGGGRSYDELAMTVSDQAGPFEVTFPSLSSPTFTVGNPLEILWDVANTDQAPINCKTVDILLSTDGGFTYDVVLAQNIPNNGKFTVCTPNFPGTLNRIQVRAADNIFFNISKANFTIVASGSSGFSFFSTEDSVFLCKNSTAGLSLSSCVVGNTTEKFGLSAIGLPPGTTFRSVPDSVTAGQPFNIILESNNITPPGNYSFTVNGASASGASSLTFLNLEVIDGAIGFPAATTPNNISDASLTPSLSWTAINGISEYYYELSTDPGFNNVIRSGSVVGNSANILDALTSTTTYYWRVAGLIKCGNGEFSPTNIFRTSSCSRVESTTLPRIIDAFGSLPIEVRDTITYNGPVPADVDVFIKAEHDQINDISASVISPSGIELNLFSTICDDNAQGVDLIFDSEALTTHANLPCPPTTGGLVQPQQDLSFFYGTSANGQWQLRIRDFESFNGGEITSWGLLLCQPTTSDLQLVNNNNLSTPGTGISTTISSANLKAQSTNVVDADIAFTLVSNPASGVLTLSGDTLEPGDVFTQEDLENGLLAFAQNGLSATNDFFQFLVEDPNGGWIGPTQFTIAIGTHLQGELGGLRVMARPNPTKGLLSVDLIDVRDSRARLTLVDMQGRALMSKELKLSSSEASTTLDLASLPSGIYFLQVETNSARQNIKIMKD